MTYFSIIEDYYLGKLVDEALEKFIRDLEINSELKKEFETYKKAVEFILSQEKNLIDDIGRIKDFQFDPGILEDIRKYRNSEVCGNEEYQLISLLKINREKILLSDSKHSLRIRWYKIVAGFLLLIGTGGLFYIFNYCRPTNDEIFDKYFIPYCNSFTVRSSTKNIDDFLIDGSELFMNGYFVQALQKFQEIPDTNYFYNEIIIVKAMCYMELEHYNLAIDELNRINEDSFSLSTGLWYKGLCYLKLKENNKAITIFQKINSQSEYYKKETDWLLRNLK